MVITFHMAKISEIEGAHTQVTAQKRATGSGISALHLVKMKMHLFVQRQYGFGMFAPQLILPILTSKIFRDTSL
jgi:hypothetical protein